MENWLRVKNHSRFFEGWKEIAPSEAELLMPSENSRINLPGNRRYTEGEVFELFFYDFVLV